MESGLQGGYIAMSDKKECTWCHNKEKVQYVEDLRSNRYAKYCPKCDHLSIGVIDVELENW